MEVNLGDDVLKNIWVKITGMLQHNWAFIDVKNSPTIIYFFDDNKRIFDQLEFGSTEDAISGLKWNEFSTSWEQRDLFQRVFGYGNITKIYKNNPIFHKPYSIGGYWKTPPDGFRNQFEPIRANDNPSFDDMAKKEVKTPKLHIVETVPLQESEEFSEKLNWDFPNIYSGEILEDKPLFETEKFKLERSMEESKWRKKSQRSMYSLEVKKVYQDDGNYKYDYEKKYLGWCVGKFKNNKRDGPWEWYHKNDKLLFKGKFKDGELDGICEWFYENGNIESKGCFEKGLKNGAWTHYYKNLNVKSIENFTLGKRDGVFEKYAEDGSIEKKETYKDNELVL